jgi:hypothetical protein
MYTIEVKGERPIHFLPGEEQLATIAAFRRGAT